MVYSLTSFSNSLRSTPNSWVDVPAVPQSKVQFNYETYSLGVWIERCKGFTIPEKFTKLMYLALGYTAIHWEACRRLRSQISNNQITANTCVMNLCEQTIIKLTDILTVCDNICLFAFTVIKSAKIWNGTFNKHVWVWCSCAKCWPECMGRFWHTSKYMVD